MNILDRGYGIAKIHCILDKTVFRTESLPDRELSKYVVFGMVSLLDRGWCALGSEYQEIALRLILDSCIYAFDSQDAESSGYRALWIEGFQDTKPFR